jgi:tetratricopeptide (TPR) repeat protein
MDRYHPKNEEPLEIASLGRYQIRGRIGRGTMGIVYRGYDPVLAREIALKTVDLSPALGAAEREAFLARFFQEARIAAKLLHPNIVVTHDAASDEKTSVPFIAMELVTGGSLADRIEREGPLAWREASRLVVLLARGLEYAHREGVVHRDVKPANVLLTAEGVPKIADFGIAKLEDAHLTHTGAVIGTPYYMSPEQLEGGAIDGRSDLFSLGSLFYALLTGRPPFVGPDLASITRQVLHKNPDPPSEVVSGIPRALDLVLARALAKELGDRFESGAELAEDVERVMRGEAPLRPLSLGEKTIESRRTPPSSPEIALEPARSSGLGIFLFLLLAGLGGYVSYAHWEDAEEAIRKTQEEARHREELRMKAAAKREGAREAVFLGRWEEAGRAIEEGLALSREGADGAGEAEALLLRGTLRADTGEWSMARADLDSAASVFEIYGVAEGSRRALLERANLERDLGAYERAEALYARLNGPDVALGKALSDLMQGDWASAESGFRAVLDEKGAQDARARAALYLGILAYGRGETEDAERFWSEAREGLEAHEIDLIRGYAALASGKSEESRALFREAADSFGKLGREPALLSAREGLAGRTAEGTLRTIFLGEARTKRSEERRNRLPAAISPPGS